MTESNLFITGASGYIGRHFSAAVDREGFRARCLLRQAPAAARRGLDYVIGDLLNPETYVEQIRGCHTVVHLAAATGRCRRDVCFRVNTEGTRRLVEACKTAGVRRFLYVSTIAATFDEPHYHYAEAKRAAEEIVLGSGLATYVLRPTMVMGAGAPVLDGFMRLAELPIVPVFGDGRVRVQPIFVEDLVQTLLAVIERGPFENRIFEARGPEALSINDVLRILRRVRAGRSYRAVHVPLVPVQKLLGWLEPWLLPLLPFTAGQLATFACDGCGTGEAAPMPETMKTLEEVVRAIADKQRHAAAA